MGVAFVAAAHGTISRGAWTNVRHTTKAVLAKKTLDKLARRGYISVETFHQAFRCFLCLSAAVLKRAGGLGVESFR